MPQAIFYEDWKKEMQTLIADAFQEVIRSPEFAAIRAEGFSKESIDRAKQHRERKNKIAAEASRVEDGKGNGEVVQGVEGNVMRANGTNVMDGGECCRGGEGCSKDASSSAAYESAMQGAERSEGSEKEGEKTEVEMEVLQVGDVVDKQESKS